MRLLPPLVVLALSTGCLVAQVEIPADLVDDADGDGSPASEDCDDGDDSAYPGNVEVCDGVDNDCDGTVDLEPEDGTEFFSDGDADGYGAASLGRFCEAPSGAVEASGDCNDADGKISPGATESCNEIDDNCDGNIDEGPPSDAVFYWADTDNDTYGDVNDEVKACNQPTGYVDNFDDCDDADNTVAPDRAFFADIDGDGYGDPSNVAFDCTVPSGYTTDDQDCDDADAAVNPETDWWFDNDHDTYGLISDPYLADSCTPPNIGANFATRSGDCADFEPDRNPATEWAIDVDGDGYGDASTVPVVQCAEPQPSGSHVPNADDCDDTDITLNPDTPWYRDEDGDGYGDPSSVVFTCTPPDSTWVLQGGDCFDRASDNKPGPHCQDPVDEAFTSRYSTNPDELGAAVAFLDNIDGLSGIDFVLGAPSAGANAGNIHYENGFVGPTSLDVSTSLGIKTGTDGFMAGSTLARGGDWDGDGFSDAIAGAPHSNLNGFGTGEAWIIGSASMLDSELLTDMRGTRDALHFVGEAANYGTGSGLAAVGQDLVLGAPDGGGGHVYVFRDAQITAAFTGGSTQFITGSDADAVLDATSAAEAGAALAAIDVDGDGTDDLAIGMPGYNNDTGAIALIDDIEADGNVTLPVGYSLINGNTIGDRLGATLANAGDVTGDGYADLLISAPQSNGGEGTVWLFPGRDTLPGSDTVADASRTTYLPPAGGVALGQALAGDDLDQDGLSDVVIGEPGAGGGRVWFLFGDQPGQVQLDEQTTRNLIGLNSGDRAGASLDIADADAINGPDILIGAPGAAEVYIMSALDL